MNSFRFPAVFLSHGTPMLAFGDDAYQRMLRDFSQSLPKPKALIFVSAHSVSGESIHVSGGSHNIIHHDFAGFPKELYEIKYTCPGSPEVASTAAQLLKASGFQTRLEGDAALDHGIWIPLMHLYPKGDIPVVRVSLPREFLPAQILKMGHVLSQLREQGVLLVASGGAVHNLKELKWSQKSGPGNEYAVEFEKWLIQALKTKNVEALVNAEEQPFFKNAHPTTEHYDPILFTVGASLSGDNADILFEGVEYGSLSMLCFSLNHAQTSSLH